MGLVLRFLGLSSTRYYAWRKLEQECRLDDRESCPRTTPTQLTSAEIRTIREMVTDVAQRHMSVRALTLHAQRIGKMFAATATWARLIRERGWRRPRERVHPPKPREGVRATRPNEYWHVDVTIIKLLDGTRVYLHAVIDNFSRRILAWKAALRLEPANTCEVLMQAAKALPAEGKGATVVADSGVENVNDEVDSMLNVGVLRRVLAQVEETFSNSMIEAWWRCLKHGWLYLNTLDTLAAVERLVAFYVHQHNSVMPHAAFHGQTPDEVFFGRGDGIPAQLAAGHRQARLARLAANRAMTCSECVVESSPSGVARAGPNPPAISEVLQLRTAQSGMS